MNEKSIPYSIAGRYSLPNFAAGKPINRKAMKKVTMTKEAYDNLMAGILRIERLILGTGISRTEEKDRMRVDKEAACRYLGVSPRTLQRLRSNRRIAYSVRGGKTYYTLGELRRVLTAGTVEHGVQDSNDTLTA